MTKAELRRHNNANHGLLIRRPAAANGGKSAVSLVALAVSYNRECRLTLKCG